MTNLKKAANELFHLILVGVDAQGNETAVPKGVSLAFNKSSGTMTGRADDNNLGEVLSDSVAEDSTLTPVVAGNQIPLEADSASPITVTTTAVENPAVALRIKEVPMENAKG